MPRACALVQLARSTFHYVAKPNDDSELLKEIHDLVAQHPRYGYRRISVLLRRTRRVNEKRVRRLWHKHRLQVQRVRRRRLRPERPPRLQLPIQAIFGPMILWKMRLPTAGRYGF